MILDGSEKVIVLSISKEFQIKRSEELILETKITKPNAFKMIKTSKSKIFLIGSKEKSSLIYFVFKGLMTSKYHLEEISSNDSLLTMFKQKLFSTDNCHPIQISVI